MKAIRIHNFGGPDVLSVRDDLPEPPVGPDAVLIATLTGVTSLTRRSVVRADRIVATSSSERAR